MFDLNDPEPRLTTLERARKDLEEALQIMTLLEASQNRAIAEQAKFTKEHQQRMQQLEEEHRRMNQETDKRIADLVSAIGRLISNTPKARV